MSEGVRNLGESLVLMTTISSIAIFLNYFKRQSQKFGRECGILSESVRNFGEGVSDILARVW